MFDKIWHIMNEPQSLPPIKLEITKEDVEKFKFQIDNAREIYGNDEVFLNENVVTWVWQQYQYRLDKYAALIDWCDSRMASITLKDGRIISCGIIGAMREMAEDKVLENFREDN